MTSRVAAVVLNWRGLPDTLECVRSLEGLGKSGLDIIIVDNDSADGSEEALRQAFPGYLVLQSGANLGYAGGNNRGIDLALARGADFIWLVNNDAVVAPDALDTLLERASSDVRIGIVGSKIYFANPPDRLWGAGGVIDWGRHRERHLGYRQQDLGQFDCCRDVDYVSGCSLLVTRDFIEKVGLLDEGYFLYFEETDWCIKGRNVGFRVVYEPRSRVWHKVSATTGRFSPVTLYYYARNCLAFFHRHGHRGPGPRIAAAILFGRYAALATLYHLFKGRDAGKWAAALSGLFSGIRDYRAGVWGPRPRSAPR